MWLDVFASIKEYENVWVDQWVREDCKIIELREKWFEIVNKTSEGIKK